MRDLARFLDLAIASERRPAPAAIAMAAEAELGPIPTRWA